MPAKLTDAVPEKLVPVNVTSVPPAAVPLVGLIDVRVGVAATDLSIGKKQANNASIVTADAKRDFLSCDRITTSRR
jgi:hypothetical protein